MSLEEKMFMEVENWCSSGEVKLAYLADKEYSEAKFNYWLAKWKAKQAKPIYSDGFREIGFSEVNPIAIGLGKVLEIEAPSGIKITVFA
jgi:hypothetical protein